MSQIHGQLSPTWYKRPIFVFSPYITFKLILIMAHLRLGQILVITHAPWFWKWHFQNHYAFPSSGHVVAEQKLPIVSWIDAQWADSNALVSHNLSFIFFDWWLWDLVTLLCKIHHPRRRLLHRTSRWYSNWLLETEHLPGRLPPESQSRRNRDEDTQISRMDLGLIMSEGTIMQSQPIWTKSALQRRGPSGWAAPRVSSVQMSWLHIQTSPLNLVLWMQSCVYLLDIVNIK